VTTEEIQAAIQAEATRQGVNPALALAVAEHESSFNPNALGAAGDAGLFQLIPSTQRQYGVTNPFDISQNIQGGVSLLRDLTAKYGDNLAAILQSYNGGEGNYDRGTVSTAARNYSVVVSGLFNRWLNDLGIGTSSPGVTGDSPGDFLPAALTRARSVTRRSPAPASRVA